MNQIPVYRLRKMLENDLFSDLVNGLDLPIIEALDQIEFGLVLVPMPTGLGLYDCASPRTKPFSIDFTKRRKLFGSDALRRAIGKPNQSVVDATAGWCQDAWHLVRQGFTVTAIEQSAIIVAMLKDAKYRSQETELMKNLTIIYANSSKWMLATDKEIDVVYLDPMFPPKPKFSSAVKKEIKLLQKLVGNPHSAISLIETALRVAKNRVVVKRPHYATSLMPGKVGETRSKLLRFDIYKP